MSTKEVTKALKISDIEIANIVIGTNKTGKMVPIMLGEKLLVCQTPFLEVKGDLRKTPYPNIYQMDTLFRGDSKQKMHRWYNFVENLESHISNQVMKNGSKWFTEKNGIFKSIIHELDTEKGVYFIKWPIDMQTNIFVDEHKNVFNPADLRDKDKVKLIIEVSNLWINGNQCGLAVMVHKILVKQYNEKILSEYIFDDSDSEPDEHENNLISLLATEQKPISKQTQAPAHQPKKDTVKFAPVNTKTKPVPEKDNKRVIMDNTKKNTKNIFEDNVQQKKMVSEKITKDSQTYPGRPSMTRAQPNNSMFVKEASSQKKDNNKLQNKNSRDLSGRSQNMRTIVSDESGDELSINSDKISERNIIKHLVEEYSPSSDEMAEINEDDLDFE